MTLPSRTSSVTRWLLVVVGCAVLETAQPMKAAAADAMNPVPPAGAAASVEPAVAATTSRTGETLLIPGGGPRTTTMEAPRPTFGASWFVVIALCGGGAAWFWWRRRAENPAAKGPRQIRIEESRPLGNRQYLVVAQVGGKKFLLGVTPGSIQMLSPLEKQEEPVYEPQA